MNYAHPYRRNGAILKTPSTEKGEGFLELKVDLELLENLSIATPPTYTQQSLPGEDRDPDDDDDQGTGDIDNPTTQTKVSYTTVLAKKRKATDDIGKQLVNVLKESANERRQHEKETLEDPDRLFLMSLIKDFKNIPQHRKLSAKRQILLVIEQNQLGDFNNMGHCHEGSSQSLRFFGQNTQPIYGGYDQRIYQQGSSIAPPMNTGGNNYEPLTSLQRNTSTPHSMTGSNIHEDDQVSPLVQCFDDIKNSC
ncbi:hypothetical protein J6590_102282 [Homalodisca vitripennis]|nr:hypothetical protein J6590_102282 [Homalodisca vitripennis]